MKIYEVNSYIEILGYKKVPLKHCLFKTLESAREEMENIFREECLNSYHGNLDDLEDILSFIEEEYGWEYAIGEMSCELKLICETFKVEITETEVL